VPRVNKNGRIFKIFLRRPPKKEGILRRFNIALTGPCWQQTPFCDKIHGDNEKERKKKEKRRSKERSFDKNGRRTINDYGTVDF
jgi:hypothetical protein